MVRNRAKRPKCVYLCLFNISVISRYWMSKGDIWPDRILKSQLSPLYDRWGIQHTSTVTCQCDLFRHYRPLVTVPALQTPRPHGLGIYVEYRLGLTVWMIKMWRINMSHYSCCAAGCGKKTQVETWHLLVKLYAWNESVVFYGTLYRCNKDVWMYVKILQEM